MKKHYLILFLLILFLGCRHDNVSENLDVLSTKFKMTSVKLSDISDVVNFIKSKSSRNDLRILSPKNVK